MELVRYFDELYRQIELLLGTSSTKSSLLELKNFNEEFYRPFKDDNYSDSFANPEYCNKSFGNRGNLLSAIYAHLLTLKDSTAIGNGLIEDYKELIDRLYKSNNDSSLSLDVLFDHYHPFTFKLQEFMADKRIRQSYCNDYNVYEGTVLNEDLTNTDYLYRLDIHVTEKERMLSNHMTKFTDEELDELAESFFEAYMRAFPRNGLVRGDRNSMAINSFAGLERLTKALHKTIERKGFKPFISSIKTPSINKQFEVDHNTDDALYLSDVHLEQYEQAILKSFESKKHLLDDYSGSFVILSFGEDIKELKLSDDRPQYDKKQTVIKQQMSKAFFRSRENYIPEVSRNYSIMGLPGTEIHQHFDEVFDSFIQINKLDNETYEELQKIIIDELDKADHIHIVGAKGNMTDIVIKMQQLNDIENESLYFNCGADANIPVGEVFTTPMLKGTKGKLHFSSLYVDGLIYKDLVLEFTDGLISDYNCSNSDDESKNKIYVKENLLESMEGLPMGEFAVGTNTFAYKLVKEYGIIDKLHPLFIEKMGPHFAIGDTCYSEMEDIRVFNPDGKEVIAKDNEMSVKRLSDMDKAYTYLHKDLTLAIEDIGKLTVVTKSKEEIAIIENGRYSVAGLEELNKYL